jgi:hypothetical protein
MQTSEVLSYDARSMSSERSTGQVGNASLDVDERKVEAQSSLRSVRHTASIVNLRTYRAGCTCYIGICTNIPSVTIKYYKVSQEVVNKADMMYKIVCGERKHTRTNETSSAMWPEKNKVQQATIEAQ